MPGVVTVALKHPHGLLCRIHELKDEEEPLPGGGSKPVKRWRPTGETFKLHGYSRPAKDDEPAPPATAGGFVLTHGVDKDLFDKWMMQNRDLDIVRNGLLFAHEKRDHVVGESKDKVDLKCGLEPIDRSKLPKGIATAEKK
jgi:hypothetical protein